MKKSNEINLIPKSSGQVSDAHRGAPAPTLMYLIELDPNVSTCLAAGSLPLQMLNVNQNNTHYLIPIQGTDPLGTIQYKHQQYEEAQAQPCSSEDKRIGINKIRTNDKLQSHQSKARAKTIARDKDGCTNANKRPAVYDSHQADLNINISGSEESFEQRQSTIEIISSGPEEPSPVTALDLDRSHKYVVVADSVPPSRAVLSLPAELRLHRGRVTPRRPLPPARFGPVRGVERDVSEEEARELVAQAAASSTPVFLLPKGDGSFRHIDVSDPEKSNWYSLLPMGARANVWLQAAGASLRAVSTRRLPPRAALCLGYDASLAAALRLPRHMPVLHPTEENRAWCDKCDRELEPNHECPVVPRLRRRYRCKHCALPFARLFTLKRHISLHCKRKAANAVASTASTTAQPQMESTQRASMAPHTQSAARVLSAPSRVQLAPSHVQLARSHVQSSPSLVQLSPSLVQTSPSLVQSSPSLMQSSPSLVQTSPSLVQTSPSLVQTSPSLVQSSPSLVQSSPSLVQSAAPHVPDGSLHPFTTLDLPAALFDTELSSRLCADDSLLFAPPHETICTPDIDITPLDCSKKAEIPAVSMKFPQSELTITSSMKQRHKRQCGARRVQCAKSRDTARLARSRHAAAPQTPPAPLKSETETSDNSYKCEQCHNTFKRRGMLVNHSWREHGAAPRAPLRRRVRLFPCGVCDKLYRSAAKRDAHANNHHPEAWWARAPCVEAGAAWCAAAACAACPRQYASRAKLLQHLRHKHPHLAPPKTINSKSKQPKQA